MKVVVFRPVSLASSFPTRREELMIGIMDSEEEGEVDEADELDVDVDENENSRIERWRESIKILGGGKGNMGKDM